MEPGQPEMTLRRGKPFLVSRGGSEEAQLLATTTEGGVLAVGVQVAGGFSSLVGVCLQPCM
jgi:hypothetical protein